MRCVSSRLRRHGRCWSCRLRATSSILCTAKTCRLSFDAQLKKLLTQITIDSMSTTGDTPVMPPNLYEPLFEVTQSGWYWQIRPIDGAPGRTLVSPSLATAVLPSPYDRKFPTDDTGTRWMNVPGPTGTTIRILEFIDSPGHDPANTKYSIIVAGPLDWFEETDRQDSARA